MGVQPDHPQPLHHVDRARDVVDREAELGIDLPGLDEGMRGRLDPGRHTQHHLLALGRDALQPLDLVERVDDDRAHPAVHGVTELGLGLVVAVQVDAFGRETAL
jgi:hypothetical protein